MTYELDESHDKDEDEAQEPEDLAELGSPVPGQAFTDSTFNPYDYTTEIAADGLPVEATPPWQSADTAPIPLTPETVQCLEQPKTKWNPKGLAACRYYKRQRVHNAQAPDRPMIQRFCTRPELRGINGACMTLDDSGIFECEFRDPPDLRSTLVLDLLDQNKVTLGRKRLKREIETGKTHGFRMFRTPDDVAAGRYVVPEDESEEVDLSRHPLNLEAPDPFASDDDDADDNVQATSETQTDEQA